MSKDVERKSGERHREDAKLSEQNGNVGIKNGVQLANFAVDQFQIITLLNKVPVANGGTLHPSGPRRAKVPQNGFCDSELHQAILAFQRANIATLGVVDGWISPQGRTLKLLKSMAESKGIATPGGGADEQKFQEGLSQLQIIVTNGRLLLQAPNVSLIPTEIRGQLGSIISQLERDLEQLKKGRPQGNLPVRNAAPAVGLVVIVAAVAAAATFIALVSLPGFRKAATVVTNEAIDAVAIRVQEASRLFGLALAVAFVNIAQGVRAVDKAVSDIKRRIQACGPQFATFQSVTEKTLIGFRVSKDQSVLAALLKAWLEALIGMMRCFNDNGVSPLEILRILTILNTPIVPLEKNLIDAIVGLFLKGIFPSGVNVLRR